MFWLFLLPKTLIVKHLFRMFPWTKNLIKISGISLFKEIKKVSEPILESLYVTLQAKNVTEN